jgi:hypothetical protein
MYSSAEGSKFDILSLGVCRTTFRLRDCSVITGVGFEVIAVAKLSSREVLGGSAIDAGYFFEIMAPGSACLGLVCVETLLLLGGNLAELVVGRHFVWCLVGDDIVVKN